MAKTLTISNREKTLIENYGLVIDILKNMTKRTFSVNDVVNDFILRKNLEDNIVTRKRVYQKVSRIINELADDNVIALNKINNRKVYTR